MTKFLFLKNEELLENIGKINPKEEEIIVPFFKNSDILKFSTKKSSSSKFVIYHHEKQSYECSDIPNVVKYLLGHKQKLSSRKDNSLKGALRRGRWDVISLPKVSIDFEGEKIVAPQRSKTNIFGYNNISWYASADVYFITNPFNKTKENLKYYLGLLNSKLYYAWLYYNGKRKGEYLELYQNPLSEIPIPKKNARLIKLIENRSNKLIKEFDNSIFNELNSNVYSLFDLTSEEIGTIENFYDSRHSNAKYNLKFTG